MKKVSFFESNQSFILWMETEEKYPPPPKKNPNKNNFHFWINSLEPVFQNMSDWWIKSKNQKKNILSLVFLLILKHEKQADLETWRASYRNLCILYVHITVFNVFIVFSPFLYFWSDNLLWRRLSSRWRHIWFQSWISLYVNLDIDVCLINLVWIKKNDSKSATSLRSWIKIQIRCF